MRFVLIVGLIALLTTPAFGLMSWQLSDPILNLLDNSVTEIVIAGDHVWVSTGLGLSGTNDGGLSWRSFNSTNEFAEDGVSAITYAHGRLIIGNALDSQNGSGLYRTLNQGADWDSLGVEQASGLARVCYDLASYDSVVYGACYYGGLVRSLDDGSSWQPVYIDTALQKDYEANGLIDNAGNERGWYYAAAVDPYHDDTTIVWAGSGQGVQRLYYIGKHKKLISNRVIDIATTGEDWWYATDRGITKFNDTTLVFASWDSDNGLPGYEFTSIAAKGDTVVAGVFDTLSNSAQGFVITTDGGISWDSKSTAQAAGNNRRVEELAFRGDELWAACTFGGLIKSTDLGDSWTNIYFDDADISEDNLLNRVNCLDINEREDVYRVSAGTDSGIVAFFFSLDGDLDSSRHLAIADNELWGQKVLGVATFKTDTDEEYWATVKSYKPDFGSRPATLRYLDDLATWEHFLTGPPAIECFDIEIGPEFGDTVVWVATSEGMKRSGSFGSSFSTAGIFDLLTGKEISDTTTFISVEMGEFETHFGTADSGLAQLHLTIINDQILVSSRIIQPNFDTDLFDFVGRSFNANGAVPEEGDLSGNWVVALGVQPTGDSVLVWASTRPGNDLGHRALCYTADRGQTWVETIANVNIWNIAFNGDSVFFAADEGLYLSTDFGENWRVLEIADPVSGRMIADDVPVYAMRMVGNDLWVGTEDGLALSENLEDWTIIRTFVEIPADPSDEDRSYVSPSPYSPYLDIGNLKFHYKLRNDGKVTITIYDFANNIVKTVVDGADRVAATQYDDVDTWDGTNNKGEKVAAGVYFYRLESTSGEEYWGKFMVIP